MQVNKVVNKTLLCGLRVLLQVHAVLLDDIMQQPQTPELSMVTDYETRSLRWD